MEEENQKKEALSICFSKFCMGSTFKSKEWWLEKPEQKFQANIAKNTKFEENQGQIFVQLG